MSILSDTEIISLINSKGFNIEPCILNNIQPSSIDLTLGNTIEVLAEHGELDLKNPKDPQALDQLVTQIDISDSGYTLKPRQIVLGYSAELLTFTTGINGRICNRNSLARWGFDASLGHYINPGFKGRMPLVLRNVGPLSLTIHPGMKICQLEIHSLDAPSHRNYENRHQVKDLTDAVPTSWEKQFKQDVSGMDSSLSEYLHSLIVAHGVN